MGSRRLKRTHGRRHRLRRIIAIQLIYETIQYLAGRSPLRLAMWLLPTHREVYGRCFRISAPWVSLPFGSRAFSCVSAFHAAASVQYVTRPRRLAYVEIPDSEARLRER